MNARALLAFVCLALRLAVQAATEVLPLNYRSAEEILPLAQSVLGSTGRVRAYGNQLIVSAEPEQIAELQEVLQRLDTPPRRLLITVDSVEERDASSGDYGVDGSIGTGNVRIVTGRSEHYAQNDIRVTRSSTQGSGGSRQQIQATEGYPALIQTGQSVPLTSYGRDAYGYPVQQREYRDIGQGFQVVAHVHGEQVQLDIRSQQERLDRRNGSIDTQSADTRVSGRLGEWIELGGVSESRTDSRSGLLSQRAGSSRQTQGLRLKVELLE